MIASLFDAVRVRHVENVSELSELSEPQGNPPVSGFRQGPDVSEPVGTKEVEEAVRFRQFRQEDGVSEPEKANEINAVPTVPTVPTGFEHVARGFDDDGYRNRVRAMKRDLIVVVQDLADEGLRPREIGRMFGLRTDQVRWCIRRR